MSYETEPTRVLRARLCAAWLSIGVLSAPLAVWAFRPLPPHSGLPNHAPIETPAEPEAQSRPPLDREAFATRIWAPPPPPPPPEPAATRAASSAQAAPPPPPPPPPLKIQLIAIVTDGAGSFRAAVYDPDTDRLHILGAGEGLGAFRVERVLAGSIELSDGRRIQTLALDSPAAPSRRGGGS